jgi:hypothetical protein
MKMKTPRINDMWRFIQLQNAHLRLIDLAVASILGVLAGVVLPILIVIRLHRGEQWSPDLFLMSGLCIAGIIAFLIYGSLALMRAKEHSARKIAVLLRNLAWADD